MKKEALSIDLSKVQVKKEDEAAILEVPLVGEEPRTPAPQVEQEPPRAPRKSSQPGHVRTHALYAEGSFLDSQTTDSQVICNLVDKGKGHAMSSSPTPVPYEPETPQSQYKLLPYALAAMVADGRVSQDWADQHQLPAAHLTPLGSPALLPSDSGSCEEAEAVPEINVQPMLVPTQELQGHLPAVTTPPRAERRTDPVTAPHPGRILPPTASELAFLQRLRDLQADRGESLMEMLAEARKDEQKAVLENRVLGRENACLRKELEKKN
ncbi:hypothetical protein EST38_g7168 [Candolleomyces aberdarensis]|uniref:Uncharacterized protein n=1 Tax=Candolleomyces aberdarensis TaxID=2316362 RepID=A0A4Q2DHN0_9AGAR|nr:hypothetical protein EST38_g7168 [Candolleomyces aberdarensis]